jgi:hypothetical protein
MRRFLAVLAVLAAEAVYVVVLMGASFSDAFTAWSVLPQQQLLHQQDAGQQSPAPPSQPAGIGPALSMV